MNSVWSSLLWKEWREHRAKLFALLAVTLVFLPAPWIGSDPRETVQNGMILFVLIMPAVSLFVGAGIAAGEHSRRTIGFLQALPIGTKKPAVAKLAIASAVAYAPTVLLLLLFVLWGWLMPDDDIHAMYWGVYAYVATLGLASVSLVIWMAAVGVNRSDEVRAGAIGLLLMLVYWAALAYLFPGSREPWPLWHRLLTAAAPAGMVNAAFYEELLGINFSRTNIAPILLTAAISHAILAAIYVYRFGRVSTARTQVVEQPVLERSITIALRPPRRGPIRATVWKQLRETAPLALLGAGGILCVATILVRALRSVDQVGNTPSLAHVAAIAWLVVGIFVSLVAGIGLFADDLRPQLNTFWRSRPISPDQWFAVKFTAGLLLTLVMLVAPLILLVGVSTAIYGIDEVIPGALGAGEVIIGLTLGLAAQATAFCVAAAAFALVRQPVAAAIIAIVICIATAAVVGDVENSYARAAMAVVVLATFGTAFAWHAVRKDLSWSST